jgi:hypothetical protein
LMLSYLMAEGKGEGIPLPPRCRDRVNSLYLPACGFPAPGDPRCLAHIREHSLALCQLTNKGYQPDMGQISIRPASIIAFADVFELHGA